MDMNDFGMKTIVSIALNNQNRMMLKIDYGSIVEDPDLIQILYLLIGTTEKVKSELIDFLSSLEAELDADDEEEEEEDKFGDII